MRKDVHNYDLDEVIAMIPDPVLQESRRPYYSVNQDVWIGLERQLASLNL